MIKPDGYLNMGKIINIIEDNGFIVNNCKMVKLNEQEAQRFYSDMKTKPNFRDHALHLSSDLAVALEIVGDNCINKFLSLIGPSNPQVGKK